MRDALETLFVSSDVHTALRCDGRVRAVPIVAPDQAP
jgi:hypothetical protein